MYSVLQHVEAQHVVSYRFRQCKEIKSGFSSLLCINEVATVPVHACSILLSLKIDILPLPFFFLVCSMTFRLFTCSLSVAFFLSNKL